MSDMIELRWHGRAQQGIVTAAKVLGEAVLRSGKYVQAFPEFGPERMGAPVRAFNRISEEEIRVHTFVTNPKYVLIADPTLIGQVLVGGMETTTITDGILDGGFFLVNTPLSPEIMRKKLGLENDTLKVYTIDASKISTEKIGRHMPNTTMLGALSKVVDFLTLEDLKENFVENYSKKYTPEVIQGNLEAIQAGYDEIKSE